MSFRIGYGYDVHQLAEGEELVIGGVILDHDKGSVGHSDADVLHVICDALWEPLPSGTLAPISQTRIRLTKASTARFCSRKRGP